MNPAPKRGLVPPELGQQKEEPELTDEDDIPSDDADARPPEDRDDSRGQHGVERE